VNERHISICRSMQNQKWCNKNTWTSSGYSHCGLSTIVFVIAGQPQPSSVCASTNPSRDQAGLELEQAL
jgi:hypothetical protein